MTSSADARHLRTTRTTRRWLTRGLVVLATVGLAIVGAGGRTDAADGSGWTSPLEPLEVVRGFDPPAGPYAPGHRGVDLAGTSGQQVLAAADGVVTYSGQVGGIGVVVVSHGRIRTTYQPLWGFVVPAGAAVLGGDQIGRLAPVGGHCPPDACLHWGAIVGETYVDPLALLDPGPSRLLPYWDAGGGPREPTDAEKARSGLARVEPEASTRAWLDPAATVPLSPTRATPGAVDRVDAAPAPVGFPGPPPVHSLADHRSTGAARTEDRRPLPAGVAAGVAVLGGLVAGAVFLAIRRRRG